MHGAGNDFVIIDAVSEGISHDTAPELARCLCDRRLGIGADGLMLVCPPENGSDFKLLFYNADGSLGEMCGNGARCIARYGYEHSLSGKTQHIETTAGPVVGERISETLYRIRLNDPTLIDLHRTAEGLDCAYVELGCPGLPHAVLLLDDWDRLDRSELFDLGKRLRYSSTFPKGANVSFVKILDRSSVKAITFERGVEDFTLACGTGSGAITTALTLMGLLSGDDVTVSMPGGDLTVTLADKTTPAELYLTGPTCVVFTGETAEI